LRVSVGICAYNEADNIGRLLENLVSQRFPSRYEMGEIIVVSSGSTDGTVDIVRRMSERDERIKLIVEKERHGKAKALNKIIKFANGDLLFVISADTYPAMGALAKIADVMKGDVGGACGRTIPINSGRNMVESSAKFLWKLHNRVLWEETKLGILNHLGGDMWAIRRGIIEKIPEEVINDDAYIGVTLKKNGWQVVHVPQAEAFNLVPETVQGYIDQRERIVAGHRQVEDSTGTYPTTIGAMLLKKPLFLLRILLDEVRNLGIKDYPKVGVGIFLEIIARFFAFLNYGNRASYLKWKRIDTTKSLAPYADT